MTLMLVGDFMLENLLLMIEQYNPDADFTEHGGKSVRICEDNMTLTNEEKLCIRYHMGAYEVDDWAKFDKAISRYPNVLFTHTADMIASNDPRNLETAKIIYEKLIQHANH